MKNKSAFTLVEILVVVLIIGILTAIAVPMYQSAVDKTHWSTLLPTARALKNAEEAYLMATNVYTDNADALDVAATQGDATYQLQMPDSAARYVIRGSTSKLPNVRLAQYLDENAAMAGQLHCEALTGDERATKLCEKLLNGQELLTTDDGYTSYLLDQEVDKAVCNDINGSWSTSKTKCYKTTAERCEALGIPAIAGEDLCGYKNTDGKTLKTEGVCLGDSNTYSCSQLSVKEGGKCISRGTFSCFGSNFTSGGVCEVEKSAVRGCGSATFQQGSFCISNSSTSWQPSCLGNFYGAVCVASGGGENCGDGRSTFQNGAVCYANAENTGCTNVAGYKDATSCCCGGSNCGEAPRCAESKCNAIAEQLAQMGY